MFPLFDFGSNPHPSSWLTSTMLFSPEVRQHFLRETSLGPLLRPSTTERDLHTLTAYTTLVIGLWSPDEPFPPILDCKLCEASPRFCLALFTHVSPAPNGRSGMYQAPTIFVERKLLNVTVGRDRGNNPTSPTLLPTLISQLREQTETRQGHSASVTVEA